MRLDFNVLWIDDQPERVEAQIVAITSRMEEEGFRFNATQCRLLEEVSAIVKEDVFTDQVDLILVDWDLGGGVEGQDAIAMIRETVLYKDIVFYSAGKPLEKLRQLAFSKRAEGVYFASREELVEEVIGVFDSLVKKVLDLDHARGIVLGATSDIEYMIGECLEAIHGQYHQTGKENMFKEALKLMDGRIASLNKSANALRQGGSLTDCLKEHLLFQSNDRVRLLARALDAGEFAIYKSYRPSVIRYQNDVAPKRNRYAHVTLIPDRQPHTLAGAGQVVTLEETRELRKLILTLRGEFRNLKIALMGDDSVLTAGQPPG